MATPTALTNADTTVKIDGVDLHTYGMVVSNVNNPIPKARRSVTQIFGRHGDFDFSKIYSPRTMTISGYILGDTNIQLLSNIDSLKEFFRLRDNNDTFQVIFQNQLTRYWTCKFEGQFTTKALSGWFYGKAVSFSLTLKCTKPYAEKTTVTEIIQNAALLRTFSINKALLFNYAGNVPTPLRIELQPQEIRNLFEEWDGDINEDNTLWTQTNCTGSNVGKGNTGGTFGTNYCRFDDDGVGDVEIDIDVFANIDVTKRYLFSIYTIVPSLAILTNLYIRMETDGAGGDQEVVFSNKNHRQWIELKPADMAGASYVKLGVIYKDSSGGNWFGIDGAMIQEISDAWNDALDCADPYISDIGDDDIIELKNPEIILINSINLCPYSKGDNVTDWTVVYGLIKSIPDIDESGKKCFMYVCKDKTNIANSLRSPKIYLPTVYGSSVTGLRFKGKYKCKGYSGVTISLLAQIEQRDDYSNLIITNAITGSTITSNTLDWTDFSFLTNIQIDRATTYIQLYFIIKYGISYFKDLMVEIYNGVAANDYEDYKAKSIEITADSLNVEDIFMIDSENLTIQKFDFETTPTIENFMSGFSGQRLLATPGNNVLRLSDSRIGDSVPENESSGVCKMKVTYRERYL